MCSTPFITRVMIICGYLFISLAACTAEPETAVTPALALATTTPIPAMAVPPTATPLPVSTAAPTAVLPTPQLPTDTSTAVPTMLPNPTAIDPGDLQVISPENAGQLTQLAQFGNGSIDSITWSPDGTLFVTGGSQRIDFYDVTTLQRVRTIDTYEDPEFTIDYLSFSPQGDVLVLFTHGYEVPWVTLWDTASGQELRPLDTWKVPAFTSDGQTIVYEFYAGGPLFWEDIRSGEKQGTIELELGESSWQILGPGGEMLAEVNTGDMARTVRLWDMASGQLLHTIEAPAAIYGIAFSPQGDLLAIRGEDGIVHIWGIPGGQLLHEVEGGTVVFSSDGRILVTNGYRTVRLWDTTTGQLLHTLTLPQGLDCGRSWTAAFSPNGRELAVVSVNGVLFFDVASGELQRSLDGYCFASDLAFSPNSNALITAGGYNVRTLNVHSGQLLDTRQSNEPVRSIAISPDGNLIAWGGGEQQYWVQLWDVASGAALYTIEEETESVEEVAFSPDGHLLATQSGYGSDPLVQMHEANSGKELFSQKAISFAFSPDGRLFATEWPESATIELWDATTFQLVGRFEQLALLAFSPDGNILAERGGENRDGSAAITAGWWDIDSGELLSTFVEEEFTSYRVFAFSPDNRLLLGHEAGAMGYGHTTLWDAATGEKILWESNAGSMGAFSQDGRYLATVSTDGVVRLWGVPNQTP